MPQPDDLLGADTSELTMLGQPIQRRQGERPQLECFTTRTSLTRETHRTREWVSLSPVPPHRPEIYQVAIVYAPRGGRILEAKSLREYGLSFNNSQAAAPALAGQVARDALAATGAWWLEVTFRDPHSGEGARTTLRSGDEPVETATAESTGAGRPAEGAEGRRPQLHCVTAEVAVAGEHESHERLHESSSWVSQSPMPPYLTDVYHVVVAYAPRDGQVLEPESLQAYGASFNNTMTFAEALAGQVARDVLAATGAWWVEVTFVQNIRGGWEIEAFQRLPQGDTRPNRPA
jgi:NADPH-dependent 7-cyano-7-deazaguanine reductase QueF